MSSDSIAKALAQFIDNKLRMGEDHCYTGRYYDNLVRELDALISECRQDRGRIDKLWDVYGAALRASEPKEEYRKCLPCIGRGFRFYDGEPEKCGLCNGTGNALRGVIQTEQRAGFVVVVNPKSALGAQSVSMMYGQWISMLNEIERSRRILNGEEEPPESMRESIEIQARQMAKEMKE